MSEQESHCTPGRPVPDIPAANDSAPGNETLDPDSDHSSGGRRHVPASVSKTSFTANTPASQKRAIQCLQQSLTFSDHSSPSSAASTPHKANEQGSTHSLRGSTHSAPPTLATGPAIDVQSNPRVEQSGEGSEHVSEGEASSGISVNAILSKLEQVKIYLQEAEALHMQMEQRLSEPGMSAQVSKMGKLVEDLRRQESGYLNILLKLLDRYDRVNTSQVEALRNEAESEDEARSEGEMAPEAEDELEISRETEGERGESGEANDSMSLKAELLKEQMAAHRAEQEQQEEQLSMLRQQRDMLKRLLVQQKQIEELEARQRALLQQQNGDDADGARPGDNAVAQVSQTAAAVQSAAEQDRQLMDQARSIQEQDGQQMDQAKSIPEQDGQQMDQARSIPEDEVHVHGVSSEVAGRLQQLKEKQARVEQLTTLLSQLKDTGEDRESQLTNPGSGVAAEVTGNTAQPQGVSKATSELVAVGDQAVPSELMQMHQKLREVEEARAKLTELQGLLSLLQVEGGCEMQQPPMANRPHHDKEQQQQQQQEEEDHTESEGGELERSVLSEYEERLERRRREVEELQQQRDKLLATQMRLQELQRNVTNSVSPSSQPTASAAEQSDDGVNSARGGGEHVLTSQQLASELGRQRRLYDDLLDKTQQMQSMVDEVTGTRDVTAATWGGSTAEEEEEEEGESTTSLPGGPGELDDTQESLEHTYTATLGDSVTAVEVPGGDGETRADGGEGERGERVMFRVTRHTPRHVRGGQRRMLTPDQSLRSAGKRMKLDDTATTEDKGTTSGPPPATGARPVIGSYSAVWPGVIFPRKHTREEATQTGELVSASSVPVLPTQPSLVDDHISLLHHQLGVTSSMASQLLWSQQGLVSTLCRQLDSLQLEDRIQDHFTRLHQYQAQLEQHYHDLQNAHFKPPQEEEEEEEEGEGEEEVDQEEEEPISHARGVMPPPPFTSTVVSSTTGFMPPLTTDPRTAAEINIPSNDFAHRPTAPGNQVTTEGSVPQGTYGSNIPSRRTSFLGVPPPPTNYFPHVYQQLPEDQQRKQQDEEEEERGGDLNEPMVGSFAPIPAPPPPLPSYFQHPSPYTPYHHPPWVPPTPLPTCFPSHHVTGFGHPPPPSLHPSPSFMSAGPGLPTYPSPYTRLRLSWPPAHFPGVSPVYPGYYGSAYNPAPAEYGAHYNQMYGPSSYAPGYGLEAPRVVGIGGGGGGGVGQRSYSPSGVTGVSMQVQPPTSPPSAPSVSNLQQNNTGSGLLLPPSSSSTLRPTSTSDVGPATKHSSSMPTLPTLTTDTPHTLPSSTAPPPPTDGTTVVVNELQRREREGKMSHVRTQDEESLSSLPLSVPDTSSCRRYEAGTAVVVAKGGAGPAEGCTTGPADFSVFDALRDTIYSEVATLIANNENRPHFLVELFRELQMLSSDYLRQRALYSLQDLVTRYLTEESLQQRHATGEEGDTGLRVWVGSEPTPSESLVTSDDELVRAKAVTSGGVETSSQSTPPPLPGGNDTTPFSADNLGDTVVRLDKAMTRLRELHVSGVSPGTLKPPAISPCPPATAPDPTHSPPSENTYPAAALNTEQLDEQIKEVMTEVIPLLKEHMTSSCSTELLQQIKQLVMSHILIQLKDQNSSLVETFSKQLDSSLQATLLSYINKMLKDCGEALLVEVSEVLFNELAFFKLMQSMPPRTDSDFRSVTSPSQTTTENEEEEEEGGGGGEGREEERGEEEEEAVRPILQTLSAAVAKTLNDEQEALGKSRDDELAREWNTPHHQPSSPSLDEEQTIVVELSASESKPIQSAGSGEEDVEGGGTKLTITPQTEKKTADDTLGERDETPPTPVIAPVSAAVPTTGEQSNKADVGGDTAMLAQSPPPHLSNTVIEAQMKVEQQSTEGIAGILATIEQEPELAGESDQLPQPGPSEAVVEP